jgi:hypothetical protein
MPRIALRSHRALLAGLAVASLAHTGCVDTFAGSNLQFDFAEPTPAAGGTDPDGAQPPDDTYLTFYALDHEYVLDGDGLPATDADGDPLILSTAVFEVQRFELVPVIRRASPCLIDIEEHRFPGLHATQYAVKMREATGITDPFDPPNGASEGDISDVLDADRRITQLADLEGTVKAVVGTAAFRYPDAQPDCNATGDEIPAPDCIDDESNAQRLRACRSYWAANPLFYEGSDRVFSLPLNGAFYGLVEGTNPINGGPLGGASLFVDENLAEKDSFTINWQFKDYDGDGDPDYPAGFLDTHEASATGYTFMSGLPEHRTRGVINAQLVSPFNSAIFVDVGIFPNLGEDDVQF